MNELKLFKCVARMEDGEPKGYMIGGRPGKDHVWIHKSCVHAREKLLRNALRKAVRKISCLDDDIGEFYDLLAQFDAEEHQ